MIKKITPNVRWDIMGMRKSAIVLSAVLILISLFSLAFRGLEYGVDFTGGYVVEVGYSSSADLTLVRSQLSAAEFSDAIVQHFGTSSDVLIRLAPREGVKSIDLGAKILDVLNATEGQSVEMRRIEFVGPQVGEDLREQGGLSVLAALFCIVIYIWLRFEKKFSVGSVIALVHDVVITLGVISLLGVQFDLSVLAAILAVIGYSLNDTIVVFDRIRENFRGLRKVSAEEVMNISINETLSRTVITSFTTLLVLIALFFFGGEIIHGFALALIVGVVIGTYSSIYVASAAVLALGVSKEDLMPVQKEGAEDVNEDGSMP